MAISLEQSQKSPDRPSTMKYEYLAFGTKSLKIGPVGPEIDLIVLRAIF